MKPLLTVLTLGLALAFGNALAADGEGKTRQRTKMKTCNVEAKGKKGDERRAFMKECLSAK